MRDPFRPGRYGARVDRYDDSGVLVDAYVAVPLMVTGGVIAAVTCRAIVVNSEGWPERAEVCALIAVAATRARMRMQQQAMEGDPE